MLKFVMGICVLLTIGEVHADCRWTAEFTEPHFKNDRVFSQKPRLEKKNCKVGMPPICTGFIYCTPKEPLPDDALPPHGTSSACPAVIQNGKWICPDAQTCWDDKTIDAKNHLAKVPTPAAGTGSGNKPAVTR